MKYTPTPAVTLALSLLAAPGILTAPAVTLAGPYAGPTDTTNAIDGAIASDSARFAEWADQIDSADFAPNGSTTTSDTGFNSLGELTREQIDAGMAPGRLTVSFPTGIRNGDGADFAVFENGFTFGQNDQGTPGLFAEYAYVEVSSNGSDFARFPSLDLNDGPLPGGFGASYAGYDVTNVHNLAGKSANGYGTPFDLDDLLSVDSVLDGSVDLGDIQYLRLVDVPGSGDFLDSAGNPIVDNWPTYGSGGFDFRLPAGQGVGVINTVPEPASAALLVLGVGLLAGTRRRRG